MKYFVLLIAIAIAQLFASIGYSSGEYEGKYYLDVVDPIVLVEKFRVPPEDAIKIRFCRRTGGMRSEKDLKDCGISQPTYDALIQDPRIEFHKNEDIDYRERIYGEPS